MVHGRGMVTRCVPGSEGAVLDGGVGGGAGVGGVSEVNLPCRGSVEGGDCVTVGGGALGVAHLSWIPLFL